MSFCFVFRVCVGRFSDSTLLLCVNGTQVRERGWQQKKVVLRSLTQARCHCMRQNKIEPSAEFMET